MISQSCHGKCDTVTLVITDSVSVIISTDDQMRAGLFPVTGNSVHSSDYEQMGSDSSHTTGAFSLRNLGNVVGKKHLTVKLTQLNLLPLPLGENF